MEAENAATEQAVTLRKKRARRRSGEVRPLLLATATRLFSEHGYSGVGTQEIANEAGVAEVLIFRHFGTKANLFKEAVVAPMSVFLDQFRAEWEANAHGPYEVDSVAHKWVAGLGAVFSQQKGLLNALIAASSFEKDLASEIVGRDSPLAKWLEWNESVVARVADANNFESDFPVTVRFTFALVFAETVFNDILFPGGTEPPLDELINATTDFIVGGAGRLPRDD